MVELKCFEGQGILFRGVHLAVNRPIDGAPDQGIDKNQKGNIRLSVQMYAVHYSLGYNLRIGQCCFVMIDWVRMSTRCGDYSYISVE